MARTDALKKAQDKYQKNTYVNKTVKLHKRTDKDIINHLETIDMKFPSYVRELIRRDIKESKK